jgi:hypothetical protein
MHAEEKAVLIDSLRGLFDEYLANPLYHLREAGLQARLLQLIHEHLESTQRHETAVRVVEERGIARFVRPDTTGVMARAQMEVRVQPVRKSSDDTDGSPTQTAKTPARCTEKSDIVVLRQATSSTAPITLTNYPNGPLDIVRLIGADDVDAVIELKATVSADVHMRHLFRCDVLKLLDLKARCRPDLSAHFVLIDKSLGIKGHRHAAGQPYGQPMPWWDDTPKESDNKKRPEWQLSNNQLRVVPVGDGDADDAAGVHVWQLDRVLDGGPDEQPRCRRYIATRR